MHPLRFLVSSLSLLFALARSAPAHSAHSARSNISACIGGTLYFAAHPADTLLYQSPDLFHDLYVYKCVTTVIFTSGDRGMKGSPGLPGNFSRSLEQGVETAYSWMSGLATDNQTWLAGTVRIGDKSVRVSKHHEADNVQIMYLRLPDGGPVGSGYAANGDESLRKLYAGEIGSVATTDGNATYTLDSLKDVISRILRESGATDVRVLDYKTGIPDEEDERDDHADHAVSARLVVDVMKRENSRAKLQGYAGGFARKFNANLNETDLDFKRKVTAFLKYADWDQHMCKTYDECLDNLEGDAQDKLFPDPDVLYVAEALEREYYVS